MASSSCKLQSYAPTADIRKETMEILNGIIPPKEWEELQPQIKSVMESAVSLSVPLVVDVRAGDNWMETK